MYCSPSYSAHQSQLRQANASPRLVMARVCLTFSSASVTQMWLEPSLMKMWELLWVIPHPQDSHRSCESSQNLDEARLQRNRKTLCSCQVRMQYIWFYGQQMDPSKKYQAAKILDLQAGVSVLAAALYVWIWKYERPYCPQDQRTWVQLIKDRPCVQQRLSWLPLFHEVLLWATTSSSKIGSSLGAVRRLGIGYYEIEFREYSSSYSHCDKYLCGFARFTLWSIAKP